MARPPHVVALDLGGTDLKAACVSAAGELLEFACAPSHAAEGVDALMDGLVDAARRWRAGAVAIGIGMPGVIHPQTGALVDATPHLALPRGFALRDALSQALALPVAADNDANCAAWGEYRAGAARGARMAVVVTVGTGIGCGIVADGRLLRGAWGGAGEIGHVALRSPGPACACGVEGCAEPLAGGGGLADRAREAGLQGAGAIDVFAAAERGDARAQALLEDMADALARQVACVVQAVNPDVVVLGGGVAQAGEALVRPVRERLARYAQPSHVRGLRVVCATLGNRAGVVGAGLMAWEPGAPSPPAEGPPGR